MEDNEMDIIERTELKVATWDQALTIQIHSVLIFLVYFLIPLVIISVYYYHIAKTLIKSAHNLPGEYNEHTKKQVSSVGVYVEGMLVRSSQCYFEF